MDTREQMLLADRMITLLVAELHEGGCDHLAIAAMLCAAAASLIDEALEPEAARLMITLAAAIMTNQVDHTRPLA